MNDLFQKIDLKKIPKHIAIIMDGNGRWARKRNLPRLKGHLEGIKAVYEAIEGCLDLGIPVLTLYAFSTENWSRPKSEVMALFNILSDYIEKEKKKLVENNIKLMVSGDLSKLPKNLTTKIEEVCKLTSANKRMILNIAINYGGREEIINAIRMIISAGIKEVNEEVFKKYLYTSQLEDPDLLIRTSGELRISNFLLWQIAYTELYFTDVLWPDFKKHHLYQAVLDYQHRERRFGGI